MKGGEAIKDEENAKELAWAIYPECQCEEVAYQGDCWHCKKREKWIPDILAALKSCREEEAQHRLKISEDERKTIRNEALDEAVKVARGHQKCVDYSSDMSCECGNLIADDLTALKTKG